MQIDGLKPLKQVRPSSIGELGQIIRHVQAENLGIYPFGGGTMLHLGLPPQKPGFAVDMTAMGAVIDYPARDMTITVQAGIRIADLQNTLAAENQWLPIDVPQASQATLGGAIAANVSGPRRLGFGTLRDYVIGVSFMTDEGTEAKAGGRVVKNVAGYDLMKLHTGAFGTLGVLTQVTLKVRPRPEASALLRLSFGSPAPLPSEERGDKLRTALDSIHASATRPVAVDVVHAGGDWNIFVAFEENQEAVRWQQEQLGRELTVVSKMEVLDGESANAAWKHLTESSLFDHPGVSFKASLLPSAVAEFLIFASSLGATRLHSHAGSGIVHGHIEGGLTLDAAASMLKELRSRAVAAQGNLIVARCPIAWKRELPIWGEPRGDWALMKAVKKRLDAQDIFNPGRFVV